MTLDDAARSIISLTFNHDWMIHDLNTHLNITPLNTH